MRETEIRVKTVVQELFSYDPSLIFASVNLQDTKKERSSSKLQLLCCAAD